MITQEQDHPIVVSKVRYLGSSLLPSPIELEATISLYHNRMHIPELDATIPLGRYPELKWLKERTCLHKPS
jgi:hypothetical protein